MEAGGIEPPSKTAGLPLPRASPQFFSRLRSLPGSADLMPSSIDLTQLATNRSSLSDPDLASPELSPTGSRSADAQTYIRLRKRSYCSQLLRLPLLTRPAAPRLATESRTSSVEPVRPHWCVNYRTSARTAALHSPIRILAGRRRIAFLAGVGGEIALDVGLHAVQIILHE